MISSAEETVDSACDNALMVQHSQYNAALFSVRFDFHINYCSKTVIAAPTGVCRPGWRHITVLTAAAG